MARQVQRDGRVGDGTHEGTRGRKPAPEEDVCRRASECRDRYQEITLHGRTLRARFDEHFDEISAVAAPIDDLSLVTTRYAKPDIAPRALAY